MRKIIFTAALAAATCLSALPAQASFAQFMAATCGPSCADPVGEQSSAQSNWNALKAMGTTDLIGASVDGINIDASGLLAAARLVGAPELDRWLRGGSASSNDVVAGMMSALTSGGGIDLGRITGMSMGAMSSGGGVTEVAALDMTAFASGSMTGLGPGGGGSAYCDQVIDSAQNASAQNYVNEVVEIAMSDQYGFSQVGGAGAGSSDQRSKSGLFGGSCLDLFMTGDFDTLFRPPQLSELVSKMTDMFSMGGGAGGSGGGSGGGAAGGCAGAPSIADQVNNSMPSAIFTPGRGGFFPAAEFGGGEGVSSNLNFSNNYGINASTFGVTGGGASSDLSALFRS